MTVRTRFAPSPTGVLHLGSVRTALFCWLYARHHDGQFILRIEDTDKARSTKENVDAILEGMEWLGLNWDEGPFFQSGRYDRYREVIDQWLEEDKAYHCYCTKEELEQLREKQMADGGHVRYDGRCRERTEPREGVDPVVRFKNPIDGQVVVEDQVRGTVVFENVQLDDLIIARSDGSPTYNFSVIIDDYDMRITHVIRGDDHLNNTPRQMNMLTALGAEPPTYAHLPMILGSDGAKLSKRHGAVDIRDYLEQGYLPEAMLNYLVRLGWSHGDQEVFSADEMIEHFIQVSALSFFGDQDIASYGAHYYQSATQMGYYGFETDRFEGLLKYLPMQPNPSAVFMPDKMEREFDASLTTKVYEWTHTANNMIYINGALDTWSATAAPPSDDNNSLYFFMKDKHHSTARIKNMSKHQRSMMIGKLEEWLDMTITSQP